jgi:hypothetical protein
MQLSQELAGIKTTGLFFPCACGSCLSGELLLLLASFGKKSLSGMGLRALTGIIELRKGGAGQR